MSLVYSIENGFPVVIIIKKILFVEYVIKKLKFKSSERAYTFDFETSDKYNDYSKYNKLFTKEFIQSLSTPLLDGYLEHQL